MRKNRYNYSRRDMTMRCDAVTFVLLENLMTTGEGTAVSNFEGTALHRWMLAPAE